MRKTTLVLAIFAALFLSAAFPNHLSACRWRLLRRSCCNKECQQATVEAPPSASTEQPAVKLDYASQIKKMTEAPWCQVSCNGRFLLKAEKLRKPLNELVRQARGDFRDEKIARPPRFGTDVNVDFLDQDGKSIGGFGFWTIWTPAAGKASPGFGRPFSQILFATKDTYGILPFDDEAIVRFMNDIKPALHDFENNCEALSSGKKHLVNKSFAVIAQKDPFSKHSKKVIELIEPFLRDEDRLTRSLAASALLRLVPNHKEAKRVEAERD